MKSIFSFDNLNEALRQDAQLYINNFSRAKEVSGPILAFCLYYDSENGSVSVVMLPLSVYESGVEVSDVAAWVHKGDLLDAQLSENTLSLLEQYGEQLLDDETSDSVAEQLKYQFRTMLLSVLDQLSFELINKAPDFMYFACPMDEDDTIIEQTVGPVLMDKYFGC